MQSNVIEEGFQRVWAMFQETDRQFKETDKKFQETDKKFQESIKETDRRFQETDKKFQEAMKRVDALTGKWGAFVEGLVAPNMAAMFESRGIEIERIFPRAKAHDKQGDKMEIDILGVNGEYVVIVEVKSTLGVDDVKEHIERIKNFRNFFPEYAERKIIGAVAGIVIDEGADKFAYRKGLFVIAQTGDIVKILNDEKFRPKAW